MRRGLTILVTLLTIILILMHTLVPHHHHNKVPVAIVNVQDERGSNLFSNEHRHEHHHEGDSWHQDNPLHHEDGESEGCLMSEAEVAATLKKETDNGVGMGFVPQFDKEIVKPILLDAIRVHELSPSPDLNVGDVGRRPYVINGHTEFVTCGKGFRAPPVC